MHEIGQDNFLDYLVTNYFSDETRLVWLRAGDILLNEGDYNDRLYFVRTGNLQGSVTSQDGSKEVVLTAQRNNFIGVYSFFSKTYSSLATIHALSDCELAFIDKHTGCVSASSSIEKEFMPVAVKDLINRQTRLLEMSHEKQLALKKLLENQNLASLGQIAAGIAHELNNSIAVLSYNSKWLAEQLNARHRNPLESAVFETGLLKGQFLSSREIRDRKKKFLTENPSLSEGKAGYLAQMGFGGELLQKCQTNEELKSFFNTWQMGVALHDMQIAADQSSHVVKSVKTLGSQNTIHLPGVDINDTIENALTLLRHKTRNISVQVQLESLPSITANRGEFIQVWTNLIKNSCEALQDAHTEDPKIGIYSKQQTDTIVITITDNGPGIPKEIFTKIFQPDITTKINGMSFGLGLGLTIVKRIVNEHNGRIDVQSSGNNTSFIIYIPVGGNNE